MTVDFGLPYGLRMKAFEDLSVSEVDVLIRRAYEEFALWQISPDTAGLTARLQGHINVLHELARSRPQDARRIKGLAGRLERFRAEVADRD